MLGYLPDTVPPRPPKEERIMPEANGWINVEERLPAESEWYLVWVLEGCLNDKGRDDGSPWHRYFEFGLDPPDGGWYDYTDERQVTHWQAYPGPPYLQDELPFEESETAEGEAA